MARAEARQPARNLPHRKPTELRAEPRNQERVSRYSTNPRSASSCERDWRMVGHEIAVTQLRFPKRELRIACAKREHGIRQGAAVDRARVDAHQDSAVGTAFNFPTGEIVQGRLGSAWVFSSPVRPVY